MCAGAGIDELDVVDLLTSLVDKSLVSAVQSDDGALRYQLLETLRASGSARLDEQATPRRGRTRWSGATRRPPCGS